MAYIGTKPADKPLTAADITDSIITSAKIVDGTIVNADINASSAIALSKLSATGTSLQVLRMNSGATALEFATPSGAGEGFSAFDMTSNASGTLVLSSTLLNTNSNYSTINGRYTAPSTGTYYFFAHAIPVSTSGDFCFTKNGSNLAMGTDYGYSADGVTMGNISIVISLTASDYINFKTAQTVYTNYIAFGGFKLY
jgi:hypothetical protein